MRFLGVEVPVCNLMLRVEGVSYLNVCRRHELEMDFVNK
jgi:hypothetical protein